MSTYDLVQSALLGSAVLQGTMAISKQSTSNAVGSTICTIAYQHYVWIQHNNNKDILSLRYSDWFLTLPLLLWECALISGINVNTSPWFWCSLICVILMLVVGKLSDQHKRKSYVTTGMFFLIMASLFFFLAIPDMTQPFAVLSIVSICSWSIYGVVAWYDGPDWIYNILDLFNKAILGFFIAAKL